MLIDSHCHLSFKDYPDSEIEEILFRAESAGVAFMINIGAGEGVEGNQAALDLAEKYPQLYATVGIHPHDAKLVDAKVVEQIKALAVHKKVVAIGEIGLDFHYEHSPREIQERVLHQFIEVAKDLDKPVMIHDRDAGERTYEILKEHGVRRAMIHCFTGSQLLAKKYLDLGYFLSFTGIVTFKNAVDLQEVVRLTPIEKILVETDSPFLAPGPHRGKRNEPAFVKYVAEKIAELKGLSFEDVGRITTLNAKRFFNLPHPELEVSIAYAIRDSLYLNITNRCTLACRFCPKFTDFEVKGYYLKLPEEPTIQEILDQAGDVSKYQEVVFCGYGEPTKRLSDLLEISKNIKSKVPKMKIRLNTDGLGNLIHGRNILPELVGVIDSISVSLNAQDAKTYAKHCPSKYKEDAYPAVKAFIKEAKQVIPQVIATVVGLPDIDREACRRIAEEELGVEFRYREYNNVG